MKLIDNWLYSMSKFSINYELIDRWQDIASIPIALFICVMLWKIRRHQKHGNN